MDPAFRRERPLELTFTFGFGATVLGAAIAALEVFALKMFEKVKLRFRHRGNIIRRA